MSLESDYFNMKNTNVKQYPGFETKVKVHPKAANISKKLLITKSIEFEVSSYDREAKETISTIFKGQTAERDAFEEANHRLSNPNYTYVSLHKVEKKYTIIPESVWNYHKVLSK